MFQSSSMNGETAMAETTELNTAKEGELLENLKQTPGIMFIVYPEKISSINTSILIQLN